MLFYALMSMLKKYMSADELKKFAACVMKGQDCREESWDDTAKKYMLNEGEAAAKAVLELNGDADWVSVIAALNSGYYWNDVQSWAIDVLKEGK